MTDIHIPPEVVEAARKAFPVGEVPYRETLIAAFRAGLAAWPRVSNAYRGAGRRQWIEHGDFSSQGIEGIILITEPSNE